MIPWVAVLIIGWNWHIVGRRRSCKADTVSGSARICIARPGLRGAPSGSERCDYVLTLDRGAVDDPRKVRSDELLGWSRTVIH